MLIVSEGNWLEADELQPVCRQEAGGSAGPDQLLLHNGRLFGDAAFSRFPWLLCGDVGASLNVVWGFYLGVLGPDVQLTFSLCIWSPFVGSAAV